MKMIISYSLREVRAGCQAVYGDTTAPPGCGTIIGAGHPHLGHHIVGLRHNRRSPRFKDSCGQESAASASTQEQHNACQTQR